MLNRKEKFEIDRMNMLSALTYEKPTKKINPQKTSKPKTAKIQRPPRVSQKPQTGPNEELIVFLKTILKFIKI